MLTELGFGIQWGSDISFTSISLFFFKNKAKVVEELIDWLRSIDYHYYYSIDQSFFLELLYCLLACWACSSQSVL